MNSEAKYYAHYFFSGEPGAVYRDNPLEGKPPERYVPGSGWMEDVSALVGVSRGDLDPITKDEAFKIIERLNGTFLSIPPKTLKTEKIAPVIFICGMLIVIAMTVTRCTVNRLPDQLQRESIK